MERGSNSREPSRNRDNVSRPARSDANEIRVNQNEPSTVINIHHHHYYSSPGVPRHNSNQQAPPDPPSYAEAITTNGNEINNHQPRNRRAQRVSENAEAAPSGVSAAARHRLPASPRLSPAGTAGDRRGTQQPEELGAVGGQNVGQTFTARSFVSTALVESRLETRKLLLFAILKIKRINPSYSPETAWQALFNWFRRDGVFSQQFELVIAYRFAFETPVYLTHFRLLFLRSPQALLEAWDRNEVDI